MKHLAVHRCATAHRLLPLKIYLGPQKHPDEKLDGFEQLCSKQKTLACWHIFPISFQREKTIKEIQCILSKYLKDMQEILEFS